MTARPIIIDCDPGLDDAVNLLLAFASPEELEILGITVVAGNVGLEKTVLNARMVRELAGRSEVAVYAGCKRPLMRDPVEAPDIHGESGMGGFAPIDAGAPAEAEHGVDFIVRTLMERPEKSVTLVPTGPLTNIAMALIKAPEIADRIGKIVLMGGARSEGGNITPSSEFNIHADPHAAQTVFECGAPIVAIGLDLTHQVRTYPHRLDRLASVGNEAARQTGEMWRYSNAIGHDLNGHDGAPLHDPCTCAYLLAPDLFGGPECHIEVETQHGVAFGHTAVDYWNRGGKPANAVWLDTVDAEAVFELIYERLARL